MSQRNIPWAANGRTQSHHPAAAVAGLLHERLLFPPEEYADLRTDYQRWLSTLRQAHTTLPTDPSVWAQLSEYFPELIDAWKGWHEELVDCRWLVGQWLPKLETVCDRLATHDPESNRMESQLRIIHPSVSQLMDCLQNRCARMQRTLAFFQTLYPHDEP